MFSLMILGLIQAPPTIDTLNEWLRKRDITSLSALSTGDGSEFKVLKGGAYSVGQYGWKAVPLEPAWGKKYVVFTTPLTSEDIGELLFERVGGKLKYIPETFEDGLRLRHHQVTVKFEIGQKLALLTDSIQANVKSPASLGMHILRMSPCYKVGKFTVGDKPVTFSQAGGIVVIPAQPSGLTSLNLTYTGKVDLPQYAGSITSDNATLTNDYWYPMVNRMPTTYEISVTPPADGWKVVAQGRMVGPIPGGVKYRMDVPAIYWSLTVAKMQQQTDVIDGRTFHTWSPRLSQEAMKMQNQLFAPIIKHYSKSFSEYPFPSWGGLDSLTYGGGALEAYSFATYGGEWLPDEDPHEPAHTWWGGVMPNTYLRSFWNESFAVWCEGYYQREVSIGNNLERREAFSTVSMPNPAYNEASLMRSGVEIGTAAGELGYGKGALVLSMLEQLVGTEALLECMQLWIKGHPKGEPAEWEDFEAVVLKRLPQFELKSFFDDWFRRPGSADVQLQECRYAQGVFRAKLRWSGSKFRMPLELWFENAAGTRQRLTYDTDKADPNGMLEIKMPDFRPKKVYLDPFHKALRSGPGPAFDGFGVQMRSLKVYRDPKQPKSCEIYVETANQSPKDLAGTFFIGHPDTDTRVKELCNRAGFSVAGNSLTYKGTTIDLRKAAAFAIVDLENGKRAAVGVGTCIREPNLGHARSGLVESYGRFLRGETKFPGRPELAIPVALN
jgi:hypothetical protein